MHTASDTSSIALATEHSHTRAVTVSYPMEDSQVSECLSGAWSLALVVAPVLMACTIRHGPTSQLNVEVGEDRKTLLRIGQNYSFMSAEMTTNAFLIN